MVFSAWYTADTNHANWCTLLVILSGLSLYTKDLKRTATFLLYLLSLVTDGGLSFLGKLDSFLDTVPFSARSRSTCQDHSRGRV